MYGAPKAGQCYNVSGEVAWTRNATTAKSRSCSQKHTLWIVKVVKVPAKYKWGTANYLQYARTPCHAAVKRVLGDLGKKYGMSAYERFWLGPTAAQRAKGAHWASCEVGIAAGKAKLVSTSQHKPTKVTGTLPERLRRCDVQAADGYYYATNCSAAHDAVASKDEVYYAPTTADADAESERFCGESGRPWIRSTDWLSKTKVIITCLY